MILLSYKKNCRSCPKTCGLPDKITDDNEKCSICGWSGINLLTLLPKGNKLKEPINYTTRIY